MQQDKLFNPKYKTSLCKHFTVNGYCPLDEKCQFAHGNHELNINNNNNNPVQPPLSNPYIQDTISKIGIQKNFKTQICRHFQQGMCKLGDKCNFAHGFEEMGLGNIPPFYSNMMNQNDNYNQAIENGKTQIIGNLEICLETYYRNSKQIIDNLNDESLYGTSIDTLLEITNNFENQIKNYENELGHKELLNKGENIKFKQLNFIKNELEKLYYNNYEYNFIIKEAEQFLQQNNFESAALNFEKILYNNLDHETNIIHEKIINDATKII